MKRIIKKAYGFLEMKVPMSTVVIVLLSCFLVVSTLFNVRLKCARDNSRYEQKVLNSYYFIASKSLHALSKEYTKETGKIFCKNFGFR